MMILVSMMMVTVMMTMEVRVDEGLEREDLGAEPRLGRVTLLGQCFVGIFNHQNLEQHCCHHQSSEW